MGPAHGVPVARIRERLFARQSTVRGRLMTQLDEANLIRRQRQEMSRRERAAGQPL